MQLYRITANVKYLSVAYVKPSWWYYVIDLFARWWLNIILIQISDNRYTLVTIDVTDATVI